MSAYAIVRAEVFNPERFKEYIAVTPALLEKYGAKFLARGGNVETVEGEEETRRVVLIEFESREKAIEFYQCEEYQELLKIVKESCNREYILVDGI